MKKRIGFLFLLAAVLLVQSRLWAQSGATLQVTTDLDCSWKLDGKPQGILKPEDSVEIPVTFGKHNISAFSDDVQVAFNADVTVSQAGEQTVEIKLIKTELTVTTDLDCAWKLDGDSQGDLKAGDSIAVPISLGKHKIYALSKDGSVAFNTVVTVSQDAKPEADIKLKEIELNRKWVWLDVETGLMWTKETNIGDITWQQASDYCECTDLGNFHNWRLPTIDELKSIDDHGIVSHWPNSLDVYGSRLWSSQKGEKSADAFIFASGGKQISIKQDDGHNVRALCVRNTGE